MWVVWAVSALSMALVVACALLLRGDWAKCGRGWKFLASSGIALAFGGLGFILRFWEPVPGPYVVNEIYPLGPYVNAWAVSFGFMWLAFGLVFYALVLRSPHTGMTWGALFAAWTLAWLPHGIIGIGFATAGDRAVSFRLYQDWASEWPGLVAMITSACVLLAHFVLSVLGFGMTARSLLQRRRSGATS